MAENNNTPPPEEYTVSRSSNPFEVAKKLVNNFEKGIPTKINFSKAGVEEQLIREAQEVQKQKNNNKKFQRTHVLLLSIFGGIFVVTLLISLIRTCYIISIFDFQDHLFITRINDVLGLLNKYFMVPVVPTLMICIVGFILVSIVFGVLSWLIGICYYLSIRLMHKRAVKKNIKDNPDSDLQTPKK